MGFSKDYIKENLYVAYWMIDENGNEVFKEGIKLTEIPEEDKPNITTLVVLPLKLKSGKYAADLYTLDADYIHDFPILKRLAVTPQFKIHNIPSIQDANCGSLYDVLRYVPNDYEDLSALKFKRNRLIGHQNVTEEAVSEYNRNLRLTSSDQEQVSLVEVGKNDKFRVIDVYTYKTPNPKKDKGIIIDDNIGLTTDKKDSQSEDFIDDTVKLLESKIDKLQESEEAPKETGDDQNIIDEDKKELHARLLRSLLCRYSDKEKELVRRELERINPQMDRTKKATAIPTFFTGIPAIIAGTKNDRDRYVRDLVQFLSAEENTPENIANIAKKIEDFLVKILLADTNLSVTYLVGQVIDGEDLKRKIDKSIFDLGLQIDEYFRISQRPTEDKDNVKAILGEYVKGYGQSLGGRVITDILAREKRLRDLLLLPEGDGDSQEDEDALGLIPRVDDGSEDNADNGRDSETRRKFAERLSIIIVNTFNTNIYNISDETIDRIKEVVDNAVDNLGLSDINETLREIKKGLSNIITRDDVESIVDDAVRRVMGENKEKEKTGRSLADVYDKLDDIYKAIQANNLNRQQVEELMDSRYGSLLAQVVALMEKNTETVSKTNNILEIFNQNVKNITNVIEKNNTVIENNSKTIENNSSAISHIQNFINKKEENNTTIVDQLDLILKELVKMQKGGNTGNTTINLDIDIDQVSKIVNLIKQLNLTDVDFSSQNIFNTIIKSYLSYSLMASTMLGGQLQVGGLGIMNPLIIGMQNPNAITNILMMSMLGLGVNNNIISLLGGEKIADPNQAKMLELLTEILKLLKEKENEKEKKTPTQEDLDNKKKPIKPVIKKIQKPKKTIEEKFKEDKIKDLEKLREPKRRENLFQKIARHPIKTALAVAGIGAAIGLGAYALLPGTIANVVAGVPLLSKIGNLAMGAVMPIGIGAGAGLVAGGVLGGISNVFKGIRRERLYKKFQKKYNKAINSASVVQLAQDKVNAKKAEKEALRENLRAAKTERQRNKALRALAKKRKQITKAKNKEAKVSKKFTTKVREALDTKTKLNQMEASTGKTTAMGGAVQYIRDKQAKLDDEEMQDVAESINEELSDISGKKVDILKMNPKHQTYDAEAVDLIKMVDDLKASNEFNDTLNEIEARHKATVEEEKSIQQYDIADINKMIEEANANPTKENEELVNEVINEYNIIQRQLRAKGMDAEELPPYKLPILGEDWFNKIIATDGKDNNSHTK